MRVLKSTVGWPGVGWLWPVALLALSNCALETGGSGPDTVPLTTAVFCDIQLSLAEGGRKCASPAEEAFWLSRGSRQAAAAVLLNTNQNYPTVLDESPTARAACGGAPQVVNVVGTFPDGQAYCANPATLIDPDDFCVEQCKRRFPDAAAPSVVAFCAGNARASTNVPRLAGSFPVFTSVPGFPGGCSSEGTVRDALLDADPRRVPEPVRWNYFDGVASFSGSSLTRTAPTTGTTDADFNAGAASEQSISHGDAYVEFAVYETNKSHVVGLSQIPASCAFPCVFGGPGLADINFGISLNSDGLVYVIETGGVGVAGPFGAYAAFERFRVSVTQSSDGSNAANVNYSRLPAPCPPGKTCVDKPFFTHALGGHYPFRVDTSFREQAATVTDALIMRIK